MKRIITLSFIVAILFAANAFAQIPRTISYQGIALDGAGMPVEGNHSIGVKIYDMATNTVLYSETQTITFTKGIFNIVVGGSTLTIPPSIKFDKPYSLGISIDAGAELIPRTPFGSVPYSLHAAIADAISPGVAVVTTLNNKSGALRLVGAGSTTINTSGDSITISSSGGSGGSGIQGVQNTDAALSITNPNGPTATINIADNGITFGKISSAGATSGQVLTSNGSGASLWTTPPPSSVSVTPRLSGNGTPTNPLDIAQGVATNGQVLTWNGTTWAPATVGGGLTLPFSASTSNASDLFSLTNTGTGRSGSFVVNNSASTAFVLFAQSNGAASSLALEATNTGLGRAGFAEIQNTGNSSVAFTGKTTGTGQAGQFQIVNTANTVAALEGLTDATGNASTSSGPTGVLGKITATSAGGYSAGVRGVNSSTTGSGIGVVGYQAGSGWGVYGETPTGNGVLGRTTSTSGAGTGVHGIASSPAGIGVDAEYAGNGNGIALQVTGGYMKVLANNRTSIQHDTTVNNIIQNKTTLNYAGMAQTDMLYVTHVFGAVNLIGGVGVQWNGQAWQIYNENAQVAMPINETFNVLIIKQ